MAILPLSGEHAGGAGLAGLERFAKTITNFAIEPRGRLSGGDSPKRQRPLAALLTGEMICELRQRVPGGDGGKAYTMCHVLGSRDP